MFQVWRIKSSFRNYDRLKNLRHVLVVDKLEVIAKPVSYSEQKTDRPLCCFSVSRPASQSPRRSMWRGLDLMGPPCSFWGAPHSLFPSGVFEDRATLTCSATLPRNPACPQLGNERCAICIISSPRNEKLWGKCRGCADGGR